MTDRILLNAILEHLKQVVPNVRSTYSFHYGDITVEYVGTNKVFSPTLELVCETPVGIDFPPLLVLNVLETESLNTGQIMKILYHRNIIWNTEEPIKYESK